MDCPKCQTSLSPTGIEEGLLWKCQLCSGVAANLAVLRKHLKGDTVKKFWLEAITASTPSNRKCPSCVKVLKEFTVSREHQRIDLDLCRTCQLIWFDRDELDAFSKVEKLPGTVMDENIAIAKIQFEAQLENEQSSAENIIAQGIDILLLIIRLLLE
jgi:Zn-finger nucleic acid-binding protein